MSKFLTTSDMLISLRILGKWLCEPGTIYSTVFRDQVSNINVSEPGV